MGINELRDLVDSFREQSQPTAKKTREMDVSISNKMHSSLASKRLAILKSIRDDNSNAFTQQSDYNLSTRYKITKKKVDQYSESHETWAEADPNYYSSNAKNKESEDNTSKNILLSVNSDHRNDESDERNGEVSWDDENRSIVS